MDSIKYVGLDVHQSTISVAVLNGDGKLHSAPGKSRFGSCHSESSSGAPSSG